MPLSPLPACVLLKVTPSVSGKSKGLNTLCKLKLQPLFYMVPTPINPTCLSQGFPKLDMNPINNINGCLQLKDLGHSLCHLWTPENPVTQRPPGHRLQCRDLFIRTGKLCSLSNVSLGLVMRNAAVLQCCSYSSHHVSRTTGNFYRKHLRLVTPMSPGGYPRSDGQDQ